MGHMPDYNCDIWCNMGAHLLGGCMMWQDPSMQWLPGVLTRCSLACVLVIAPDGTIIVSMSLIEGCSTSGVKKGLLCPCPGATGHLTRRPLLIYGQPFGGDIRFVRPSALRIMTK